jgi:sec-independent protein translocase protein TatC
MLKKTKQLADDLFEKSSMSFGEHLDELRKALTKAFVWLGVGAAIGLYFGKHILDFIAEPIEKAVSQYNITKIERLFSKYNGVKPPADLTNFMIKNVVVPERMFIDPKSLDELKASSEKAATELEAADLTDLQASMESQQKLAWQNVNVDAMKRLQPMLIWRPINNKLVALSVLDGFLIWLKAGLVAGAVIGSPGMFWHIWHFLAAGLYPHERRYVYWFLPMSLGLFFGGVALSFFLLFPLVLGFLLTFNVDLDIDIQPRLNEYVSFALMLPLGFGIAFQLPLVMLALHRFGLVDVQTFTKQWRIAVLVIAFLSMVLTPADPYTMMGMFVPLVGLYFLGIALCRFMPNGPGIGSQALDPQG